MLICGVAATAPSVGHGTVRHGGCMQSCMRAVELHAVPPTCDEAAAASRLPAGHPEAFIEAFANVYLSAAAAIRSGRDDGEAFGYPGVSEGHRGMRFISAVVSSSEAGGAWVSP